MSVSSDWLFLTIGMIICFAISILLSIIQRQSFKWYAALRDDQTLYKDKPMLICLYGVYLAGSICSLQCLLNHISSYFPEWYCFYGMSFCVIFHEAAKTFGYGYFLCRANAMTKLTKINILPSYISKYVLPIYLSCYGTMYSIVCPLTFRGLSVDPKQIPTSCLFDEYGAWIFYLSVGVELFNSIFFVWLFAYPLYKYTQYSDIRKIIRYNVVFSTICCISSVLFLLYRALARDNDFGHYIWMLGNVDLLINEVATFLMPDANRAYAQSILYCNIKHSSNSNDTQTPNEHETGPTPPDTTGADRTDINETTKSTVVDEQHTKSRNITDYTETTRVLSLPTLQKHSITPLDVSKQ